MIMGLSIAFEHLEIARHLKFQIILSLLAGIFQIARGKERMFDLTIRVDPRPVQHLRAMQRALA